MTSSRNTKEANALTHRAIGAAITVHSRLGPGLLESVYEAALCSELGMQGLLVERQKVMPVRYGHIDIGEFRVDVLVEATLILEIKSVSELTELHRQQVTTYLRIARLGLGLLLNFNVTRMQQGIRRIEDHWMQPPA